MWGDVAASRQHPLVRRRSSERAVVRLGGGVSTVLRRRRTLHGRGRRHAHAPGAMLRVHLAGRRALPRPAVRSQPVRARLAWELHRRTVYVRLYQPIDRLN